MQRSWERKRTQGTCQAFSVEVEMVRDGWKVHAGSLEAVLGQFPGCGEEGVRAPAAPSVSGTEL